MGADGGTDRGHRLAEKGVDTRGSGLPAVACFRLFRRAHDDAAIRARDDVAVARVENSLKPLFRGCCRRGPEGKHLTLDGEHRNGQQLSCPRSAAEHSQLRVNERAVGLPPAAASNLSLSRIDIASGSMHAERAQVEREHASTEGAYVDRRTMHAKRKRTCGADA